ncbi:ABC transporter ATP-binding protein [Bifidobacterium saguinibicoloris]|uniref:ABC transporter ATP-binding protein n=1 Tax=Bifidobacterium saguinibicoloris TaxID=2834433 RepID=UPI001C5A2ABE|nr:ABC transporter ATP-binding protein [Bifidobacterium saguinibicoloris]MBW3080165.1 ABC transporter ATP-binding protein [Bifidobacterium saguinibicoloris]
MSDPTMPSVFSSPAASVPSGPTPVPFVRVRNLRVLSDATGVPLVDGVSFDVARGGTVGIVGESGSGKSLTLRAVMGLPPEGVRVADPAAVAFPATSDASAPRLAMIFQDPVASLDPLCGVVRQVAEVMRAHGTTDMSALLGDGTSDAAASVSDPTSGRRPFPFAGLRARREAYRAAADLLVALGLPASLRDRDRYPGQLSGGQCQRVGIAIALACRPDVLLCDEPTTALDVTVQRQILDLLASLRERLGLTMLFVTHNLGVAAHLCDRLVVMRRGRVVETGPTARILAEPHDDYTKRLIDAILPIPGAADAGRTDGENADDDGKEETR